MELDLVYCRDDGRVLQEPLEIADAPVGDADGLDFVGVLLVDFLDLLVDVQPIESPVGLRLLQV